MFHTNFFRFEGPHLHGEVSKGASDLVGGGGGSVLFLVHDLVGLDGKFVSIGSHVNDAKDRVVRGGGSQAGVLTHHIVNAQIVGTNLRSCAVKADDFFFGIDFAKHEEHVF